MESLILRELNAADEKAFFDGLAEWAEEERSWYTFDWKPGMSFPELLSRLAKNHAGEDLPTNLVPSTMLYGFVGEKIVGRVSIRHQLNEFLFQRGGHIGYSVAPRYRRQGYARSMVDQSLPVCRALGLNPLLVTCSDDNIPSWRIIEAIGGRLENKVVLPESGEQVRRYWVDLPRAAE